MQTAPHFVQPRVAQSALRQSFLTTIGARVLHADGGRSLLSAPLGEHVRQQQGAGHGGFVFTLGDVAAGYAALTLLPEENEVMSAELKIHFLRPALGQRLEARGSVLKPGRRLMVVEAEVYAITDQQEVLVAKLLGSMVPVAR